MYENQIVYKNRSYARRGQMLNFLQGFQKLSITDTLTRAFVELRVKPNAILLTDK